ncbi:MAG TPA: hypothetical protein VGF95_06340 [Solirubrobacteraceae bacterium]
MEARNCDYAVEGRQRKARSRVGLRRAGALTAALGCALTLGTTSALASSTMSIKETGSLSKVGKPKGLNLSEKGSVKGSINGGITLQLHVTSENKVSASVTVSPKGGSLSGSGSATYSVRGGYANFSGTLSITKGSGSYAGAHGSGLKFSGKIQRSTDAVTVYLSGTLTK